MGNRTDSLHRGAVFDSLKAWARAARVHFGAGRLVIGGGFVTYAEPSVTAQAVYLAANREAVNAAFDGFGVGWQMVVLEDVVFAGPHLGGSLERRSSVGGLVDARLIADEHEFDALRMLSVADVPSNGSLAKARKGVAEVEVDR
ncbi:hypothetical protein [Allobranchiibius sp. GilTou73]|uniref:hypothetical protein n=1 Tax=Allobranchiibius sp. GilTou73 TaxID=2904523 RepID=UPI001F16732C|nr:hypothetical protein [Allobranchiibius sp. GilTou73]UIJ35321.1 hypothetical protein LVQ62_02720 [Allobranchiibius sp. GilTou73]